MSGLFSFVGQESQADAFARSSILAPTIANIAAVFDTLGIVMGPVHEPAEVVPFVHSADLNPVADANWHTLGQIDVVGDKQRFTIADIQDKALVPGTVVVVRQQPHHDTAEFDPGSGIRFLEAIAHMVPFNILIILAGSEWHQTATKNAAGHPWPPRFSRMLGPIYPLVTGTSVISTRRLAWRPLAFVLSATGYFSPIPTEMMRCGITPCDVR